MNSLDAIAGEKGILNSIKCFWFGDQLDNLYDAICVSFVNTSYNVGFVYGILSFGLFFSSFFLYKYAMRMAFNSKKLSTVV